MSIDNYPPGAANDPRAPWNQKDPEMTEWEPCGNKGCCACCDEVAMLDYEDTCEECFVPEEIDHEDDGDSAYDRWKDDMIGGL